MRNLFTYLAVGLEQFERSDRRYPYPDILQHALNKLALAMLLRHQLDSMSTPYPKTITGLMRVFEQDLKTWWPEEETLPKGIDPDFPLLDGSSLEEQALEFLEQLQLPDEVSLSNIQAMLDNRLVEELVKTLRQASPRNPKRAQGEYTKARKSLIQHPQRSEDDLLRKFGGLRYVDLKDIRVMYEPAGVNDRQFSHKNREGKAYYWLCPHCGGLLRWTDGLPRCAKPSVCGKLYPGYRGMRPIKPDVDRLVLKWVLHARTCIPGIREVALFEQLRDKIADKSFEQIELELWPGIDRYDLQLRFDDEVWAIDVKDYKHPFTLGQKIAQSTLYNAEKSLAWDRGFYVVPFYRTDHQHADYVDYLDQVWQQAKENLQPGVEIVDEGRFMRYFNKKLEQYR